MNPTKRELAQWVLANRPVDVAHALGFDKLTELHNAWMLKMLYGEKDATLQAHRGSYKTTCVSVVLLIYIIAMPRLTVAFFRKTDGDVKEIVEQVSRMLKTNYIKHLVSMLWDKELVITVDNALEISTNLATGVKGTCQLTAMGIKGSMTGKHYDRIFTDDIVTIEDRESAAERARTAARYGEILNLINRGPRCKIFNTGTPWHKEDAFKVMPPAMKYDCYNTGLISAEDLESLKSGMTLSMFCANYELKHVSDEEIMFPDPPRSFDVNFIHNGVAQVDAAYGGKDYTAFSIMRKIDSKYYLFGKIWHKHVSDCYAEIAQLYRQFECRKLYIENNADKGFTAKDLRKKFQLRVVSYDEDMNKIIKISICLKAIWKNVVVVAGTSEEYLKMITDYTLDAEHDDAPDSAAVLARLLYKPEKGEENVIEKLIGERAMKWGEENANAPGIFGS